MKKADNNSQLREPSLTDMASTPEIGSDWRFLSGIPKGGSALILGAGQDSLEQTFGPVFDLMVFQDLNFKKCGFSEENRDVRSESASCLQADLRHFPFQEASFDLVAMPHGFVGEKANVQVALEEAHYRALKDLLKPDGTFYMGFTNQWNFQRTYKNIVFNNNRSSLKKMAYFLKRTGFQNITFYGAIPDHMSPLYIFPLEPNIISFVLFRHYGRKLPDSLRNMLSQSVFASFFKYFLPCYMVVAKTN